MKERKDERRKTGIIGERGKTKKRKRKEDEEKERSPNGTNATNNWSRDKVKGKATPVRGGCRPLIGG